MNNQGILLESGTNELEIILFSVGSGLYGINVMKVREIIQPSEVTAVPHAHQNIDGMIRLREEIIPVINLSKVIGTPVSENTNEKMIVAELNQRKMAFRVDSVSRIHRISWEQIEKPQETGSGMQNITTGIVKMEHAMVLLLDYEKIVYDAMPEADFFKSNAKAGEKPERSEKKLLIAEDSPTLRSLLENTLRDAGYTDLLLTEDGREAFDVLENSSHVDLVITDIEMPGMDGHHLTKKIKEHSEYRALPVCIFSSLITGDLRHKGDRVGADAQISKPEINTLVSELDRLLLHPVS
ncbi:chemotaxis protein CheV [Alkalicoccus urumqiensis]|uniref:Chemotaxis protein CheV n=1 Tax=Alkalicoccus urumqiensis TaxID=1548213 RepID=A0A2P6MDU4_ALKUR|nr:chemotaxis protein [Alkalicoccus urumqiensis]PRO64440.1 chemotaxis protein CheV [Alkalicoccus urumqiensis]